MKIEFFGAADRKGKRIDGKVTSEYPAWFYDTKISELENKIQQNENSIAQHLIPDEAIPETRENIKRYKERMLAIVNSKPNLSDKDKDTLYNIYKSLAKEIGESQFSRTEMLKGLANSREEARRMVSPIIPIKGDAIEIFTQMGIKIDHGKVSRNQASKALKLIGKLIGEPTNTEYFRKDRATGTYQSGRYINEMLKEDAGI